MIPLSALLIVGLASTLLIEDYEYCKFPVMMRPSWVMAPAIIRSTVSAKEWKIRTYNGIKGGLCGN
jgi:hypothetical protein